MNNLFLGDFNWNDVTRQAYWQIKMDKFDVQGTNVTACDQSDGCQVIIDSGTSLLGMILNDFDDFRVKTFLRHVCRIITYMFKQS